MERDVPTRMLPDADTPVLLLPKLLGSGAGNPVERRGGSPDEPRRGRRCGSTTTRSLPASAGANVTNNLSYATHHGRLRPTRAPEEPAARSAPGAARRRVRQSTRSRHFVRSASPREVPRDQAPQSSVRSGSVDASASSAAKGSLYNRPARGHEDADAPRPPANSCVPNAPRPELGEAERRRVPPSFPQYRARRPIRVAPHSHAAAGHDVQRVVVPRRLTRSSVGRAPRHF